MRLLSLLAFFGFGCSVVVHLSTFFGLDLTETFPAVWLLHLGIFLVFVPMVFSVRSLGRRPDFWQKFFAPMPAWIQSIVICLFFYVLVNFVLFFFLMSGGSPSEINGKYVLQTHGQMVRELTVQEYHQQKAYVLRGFSGHWMIFYLIPALYFWYPRSDR